MKLRLGCAIGGILYLVFLVMVVESRIMPPVASTVPYNHYPIGTGVVR